MSNQTEIAALRNLPKTGRIIALDPGTRRIGLAVTDELQTISRPVTILPRTSWKKLLTEVRGRVLEFDAVALVVGLPLNGDGSESEMSGNARQLARNLRLSLELPVLLQDERASSYEARGRLWSAGADQTVRVDAEAASIILSDFLDRLETARRTRQI